MVVYLNKNIYELFLLLFKRNARIIFNSILYFNTKIKIAVENLIISNFYPCSSSTSACTFTPLNGINYEKKIS